MPSLEVVIARSSRETIPLAVGRYIRISIQWGSSVCMSNPLVKRCSNAISMPQLRHVIAKRERIDSYVASQTPSLQSIVVFWLRYKCKNFISSERAVAYF
jgi:hypothetical protein